MKYTGIGMDKDKIWISLDGLGPKENLKNEEAIVNFVNIKSMADFEAAFNRAFSHVPLQDENVEWPADIKQAIAKRQVIKGMTTKQAHCVVGAPMSVASSEENGKKVELWIPRQNNGTHVRWSAWTAGGTSRMTGFPSSLKFVDDVLVDIGPVPQAGGKINLDK